MKGSLFYAPDLDPRIRGSLRSVGNLIPTSRGGYRPLRTAIDLSMPAVSGTVNNAFLGTLLTGSSRVFSSTDTNVYELTNPLTTPSWTSQATLVSSTAQTGIFGQYANSTVFANLTNATLISTTSGAFGTLTGASKAVCMAQASNILLLGNYNDGSSVQDGFHASDLEDISSAGWTTGTAGSYAMKGRLIDTPGPITAGSGLGDQALFFKKRGVYAGQFTRDLTNPWDFRCISRAVGCVGPTAVLPFLDMVTWVGLDSIYLYDGAQIRDIAQDIKRTAFTIFASTNPSTWKWRILHDENEQCLYYFVESGGSYLWFVYNYATERWGYGNGYNGTFTAGPLGILNVDLATNQTLISGSRKTAFVIASDDSKVKMFDGYDLGTNSVNSSGCSMQGWAYGDGNKEYESTRVRLIFGQSNVIEPDAKGTPASCSASLYHGDTLKMGSTTTLGAIQTDGTIDGGVNARWQVPYFEFSGSTDSEDYCWELHDLMLVCGDEEGPCIGGRR